MSTTLSRLFLVSLTIAAAVGCSNSNSGSSRECPAMLAGCLVNQQSCVEAAGGTPAHCEPCPLGQYADKSGACASLGAAALSHDFANFTTAPGEEVLGQCQSWTLKNPTELWVNAVELSQDVASHHSNWLYVPADKYDGPDGVWRCKDRKYDQLTAALAGGVLYAQSTQAKKEVQRFTTGAAVRIPPYARIIGDVHLLNTTRQPISGHARLALYSLPIDQVKIKLVPFHLTFEALDIPPRAVSRFGADCDLDAQWRSVTGGPVTMKVHYLLPHTHALGTRFFLEAIGGTHDKQNLIDVKGFNGEARGRAFDPAINLDGATGLRFACDFTNPRDQRVKWGFGDQEMCEVLGFAETTLVFESQVREVAPGTNDGAIQGFTGPCKTIAFPWDHNKAGGPPTP